MNWQSIFKDFDTVFNRQNKNENVFDADEFASKFKGNSVKGGTFIALLITLVVFAIFEWVALVPLNIRNPGSLIMMGFLFGLFGLLSLIFNRGKTKIGTASLFMTLVIVVVLVGGAISSMEIFHAKSYQKQLKVNEKADFNKDIEKVNFKTIPVVDRDSAQRLGNKQMGSIVDYVSQFEVDNDYTQINYQDEPYRVTTISYSGFIKWLTNHNNGLPAYIRVNMVNQEAEVVRLEKPIRYSKSDLLLRNINRHLRINYPTMMYDEPDFEIDDQGTPYYIASTYKYKIGLFGGKDTTGAILVNAITGESKYYDVKEIPQWVDRVYSESLLTQQLANWGKYKRGYFNNMFSQKGVLKQTSGYNYIAIDDDVYMYTGLTSVSSDASNVGFVLINCRTKEANYYPITGAQEESAMSSAEGKVQNLGYKATFPILINSSGEPTYFLSLKDGAGLVKKYAFVNVKNYQLVAVGDTVEDAQEAYYKLLSKNGNKEVETTKSDLTAKVTHIKSAIIEGNTQYYFKLEGSDKIYIVDITQNNALPFVEVGNTVTIQYNDSEQNSIIVSHIEVK